MLENLIRLFHDAHNLYMSDLQSCLHNASVFFLERNRGKISGCI